MFGLGFFSDPANYPEPTAEITVGGKLTVFEKERECEDTQLWLDFAESNEMEALALSAAERQQLGEMEMQIVARVGGNMIPRECKCRTLCGGIVECERCRQEAM